MLLRDTPVLRRAGAYGVAAAMHALALVLLIAAPPAVFDPARRAVSAVEVRLYTVAGGADAQSDAPLFEPPRADAPEDGAGAAPATVVIDPPADPAESVAPADPPEPAEAAPETQAPAPNEAGPEPADAAGSSTPSDAAPETGAAEAASAAAGRRAPADAETEPGAPGAPVATTQQTPPERGARRARAPSFADILARAETRLDPADFQVAQLLGGVRGATRESFCLSSASGNREAMDCPDTPNAASAELARYGLMGLGEDMPDFMEDMSRLEFQLRTLGADDSAVTRILTGLREARREAISAPSLSRQMNRDAGDRNVDNLGNPRMDSPMPGNPGG